MSHREKMLALRSAGEAGGLPAAFKRGRELVADGEALICLEERRDGFLIGVVVRFEGGKSFVARLSAPCADD